MGNRPKLRLPVTFLLVPAIFFGMFTIIFAGVAYSQGPNADWTIFLCMLGGLVAIAAVYFSGIADWISDEELQGMENADQAAKMEREVEAIVEAAKDGRLEGIYRYKRYQYYAWFALVIPLTFVEYLIDNAPTADGASSMAILGNPLGTWRIFNRNWSGVEVLLIAGCLIALFVIVRTGFDRLSRAQKR